MRFQNSKVIMMQKQIKKNESSEIQLNDQPTVTFCFMTRFRMMNVLCSFTKRIIFHDQLIIQLKLTEQPAEFRLNLKKETKSIDDYL